MQHDEIMEPRQIVSSMWRKKSHICELKLSTIAKPIWVWTEFELAAAGDQGKRLRMRFRERVGDMNTSESSSMQSSSHSDKAEKKL